MFQPMMQNIALGKDTQDAILEGSGIHEVKLIGKDEEYKWLLESSINGRIDIKVHLSLSHAF